MGLFLFLTDPFRDDAVRSITDDWLVPSLIDEFIHDAFLDATALGPTKTHDETRDIRSTGQVATEPIAWFRADEEGERGGRLHYHALMLIVAHLLRLTRIGR